MNMPTASHDTLGRLADDIRQLTTPFTIPVRQRGRRTRTTWTAVTHPPLLDQLRAAVDPARLGDQASTRKRIPTSRPTINVDASDRLAAIYVEITHWRQRLALPPLQVPHDQDWWFAALRSLVGAATLIAPAIADDLAEDVHKWWHWAAVQTGWDPADLMQPRR